MKLVRERSEAPNLLSSKMNLRLLEIFLRVAELGTMSAAGQRLGISQAAVSQSVTLLEESLGVHLFDRSVRPPALTLVGNAVLKSATAIMAKLHELQDTVRDAASGRVPLLRIGMLDSFTSTGGPHALELLKDVASEWTVVSGYRATNFQALLDRTSDVIITSDHRPVPDNVSAVPLLTESFLLVLPARYQGNATDLRSVAGELDFIRYGRDSHMGGMIDDYLRRVGAQPATRYQFDTTDALLRMVAAGFGWTIVSPLILLKSIVQKEALRTVPLARPGLRRRLVVAMRKRESEEILQRVREAALSALREVVQPQIAALLPGASQHFVVAPGAGRKGHGGNAQAQAAS